MLSEKEIKEIEKDLAHYEDKRAACVEAMKVVQKHQGWVSDEAIKDLSELLDMSPEELDGVATFYSLIFRKPVGKHVILTCDSVSCWIKGSDRVRASLARRLGVKPGETTKDGKFTLLPIPCLGTCDHAPAMMVDDDLHQDIDTQTVDTILEKYE